MSDKEYESDEVRRIIHTDDTRDPRVDELSLKVDSLVNTVQSLIENFVPHARTEEQTWDEDETSSRASSPLLTLPREPDVQFSMEDLDTAIAAPSFEKADPARVKKGCQLQHIGSADWENVRFAETQKAYMAKPFFSALEVNDEFRRFSRADGLLPQENFCAAMTNALLEQREELKKGLQEIVDWSSKGTVSQKLLSEKISEVFSPKSNFEKTSKDMMQMVCGKRSSLISQRREGLLTAIKDSAVQASWRKVPPSAENLFDAEKLSGVIQRLGGINQCLPPPKSNYSATPKSNYSEPSCSGVQKNRIPVKRPFPKDPEAKPTSREPAFKKFRGTGRHSKPSTYRSGVNRNQRR